MVPDNVKAKALADLLAGEQPAVVAARHGLDPALVRQWKRRHVTQLVTAQTVTVQAVTPLRPRAEARELRIGEQVLALLGEKVEAARALAAKVADPEWLAKQSAADVVALGRWLDDSILELGDRLAARPSQPSPSVTVNTQ